MIHDLSSISIPQNIQNFLQLGKNFVLPSENKLQLIFDFIKCIENNKYKLLIDKRISVSNHSLPILNSLVSSLIQHEVEKKLSDLAKETKIFIKEINSNIIFIQDIG